MMQSHESDTSRWNHNRAGKHKGHHTLVGRDKEQGVRDTRAHSREGATTPSWRQPRNATNWFTSLCLKHSNFLNQHVELLFTWNSSPLQSSKLSTQLTLGSTNPCPTVEKWMEYECGLWTLLPRTSLAWERYNSLDWFVSLPAVSTIALQTSRNRPRRLVASFHGIINEAYIRCAICPPVNGALSWPVILQPPEYVELFVRAHCYNFWIEGVKYPFEHRRGLILFHASLEFEVAWLFPMPSLWLVKDEWEPVITSLPNHLHLFLTRSSWPRLEIELIHIFFRDVPISRIECLKELRAKVAV